MDSRQMQKIRRRLSARACPILERLKFTREELWPGWREAIHEHTEQPPGAVNIQVAARRSEQYGQILEGVEHIQYTNNVVVRGCMFADWLPDRNYPSIEIRLPKVYRRRGPRVGRPVTSYMPTEGEIKIHRGHADRLEKQKRMKMVWEKSRACNEGDAVRYRWNASIHNYATNSSYDGNVYLKGRYRGRPGPSGHREIQARKDPMETP